MKTTIALIWLPPMLRSPTLSMNNGCAPVPAVRSVAESWPSYARPMDSKIATSDYVNAVCSAPRKWPEHSTSPLAHCKYGGGPDGSKPIAPPARATTCTNRQETIRQSNMPGNARNQCAGLRSLVTNQPQQVQYEA